MFRSLGIPSLPFGILPSIAILRPVAIPPSIGNVQTPPATP
jgi:hypothetical protein